MESHAIEVAKSVLMNFAVLFAAGALAAKIADQLKIPDVVLFLIMGIIIGPPGLNLMQVPAESALNQLMLIVGACFLLFQGGIGVSFKVLKQTWLTLILLATVAVLLMVIIVGYTAHWILGLELIYALLLSAVLASTDPATLVPIFLTIKIRPKVAETVLSESAFNDATGAICTFAVLGMISTGHVSLGENLLKFAVMAGGGILIGLLFSIVMAFFISNKANHVLGKQAQILLLPLIIAAYLSSEHFGASGFMTVFMIGLVLGNLESYGWFMDPDHHRSMHSFIDHGSLLLRMIIFILLGANVDFAIVKQFFLPGLIIIAVFMLLARPIAVLACVLPDRRARWERNEILFMFWTRETGVIPAALSGMLIGMKVPYADVIAAITFMAILATLIIQASTTRWLAAKLGLLEEYPDKVTTL
jgi:potassium/hydrogen antiporter